jgi:hypothetical protein
MVVQKLVLCSVLLLVRSTTLQIPIAVAVSVALLVTLGTYRPHKSNIPFYISMMANVATLMKYVGALQLLAIGSEEGGNDEERERLGFAVGVWLIVVDVFVIVAAVVACIMLGVHVVRKAKTIKRELAARSSDKKIVPISASASSSDQGLELTIESAAAARGTRGAVAKVPPTNKVSILPEPIAIVASAFRKKRAKVNDLQVVAESKEGGNANAKHAPQDRGTGMKPSNLRRKISQIQVTVPKGAHAGEMIKVVLAGGAVAHAKVPTGYKQGMVFQFRHDEENHAEL